jgi:hypothetical protein
MNYRVIWLSDLEDVLISLYLRARADGQGAAVTRATAEIDRRLATDPVSAGESRSGRLRILIEPPLAVDFEVIEPDRLAVVTGVRYYPPRGTGSTG